MQPSRTYRWQMVDLYEAATELNAKCKQRHHDDFKQVHELELNRQLTNTTTRACYDKCVDNMFNQVLAPVDLAWHCY